MKVNDFLTLTFKLQIAFSDFVATGGIVFHKYILFFTLLKYLPSFNPVMAMQPFECYSVYDIYVIADMLVIMMKDKPH